AQYLVKGQQVHFTIDDAHVETYTKGDNSQGVKLTGRVIIIKFAGSPPQQSQGNQQAQQPRQQQRSQQQRPAPQQSQQGTNGPDYDSFDDDIPFAPLHYLAGT
ncbi:MAG: single-stranded DNA-binding protein, partial [Pseudomonas sp.]